MVGALVSLLRNRTYLGEINHRRQSYPGEHDQIIDQDLFDQVQAILEANRRGHRQHWRKSNALLLGKIYDDRGNRMTPSYGIKRGVRYRYYVSAALVQGNKADAGSVARVAAPDMEQRVINSLMENGIVDKSDANLSNTLNGTVDRVTIGSSEITITVHTPGDVSDARELIRIPWTPPVHRRRRSFSAPDTEKPATVSPSRKVIRSEARARLLIAIATARQWLDELMRGAVPDLDAIAQRESRSERSVRVIFSLAFLSPDIVSAAIAGTLPRGLGLSDMTDLPMDWAEQDKKLGLSQTRG
jgi:hypothetical protein